MAGKTFLSLGKYRRNRSPTRLSRVRRIYFHPRDIRAFGVKEVPIVFFFFFRFCSFSFFYSLSYILSLSDYFLLIYLCFYPCYHFLHLSALYMKRNIQLIFNLHQLLLYEYMFRKETRKQNKKSRKNTISGLDF